MYKIWQQMKFYKNLLIFFWAMNVCIVATGLVISWDYFSSPEVDAKKLYEQVTTHESLQEDLLKLQPKTEKNKVYNINKQLESFGLGVASLEKPYTAKELISHRIMLLENLNHIQKTNLSEHFTASEKNNNQQSQLIWVAAISICAGFILPFAILYLLSLLGIKAKTKTETHVKEWIKDWSEEKSKHQDPFKSADFWLRIGFLSVEHFAPHLNHPAAKYFGELSHEIKTELHKMDKGKNETQEEQNKAA
ncbi:MAG: hypothetical protein VX642_15705 [Bdellovibrionota bacterium]|nr:hypothetical protein [Bdellovibrionota bacterium]